MNAIFTVALYGAIAVVAILLWRELRKQPAPAITPPPPTMGYTPLWRIPSNKNFRWLVLGVIVAIAVGAIVAAIVAAIIYRVLPPNQPVLVYLAGLGLGAIAGYEVAKPLFTRGLFTVTPGQTAFRSVLDIPFDEMEVGKTWQVPGLMKEKVVDSQAFPVVNQPEVFITANGVNLDAQMSCTVYVKDPLKNQKLRPGEAATVVGRLLSSLTRGYLANQKVDIRDVGTLETMLPPDQWKFVQRMVGFKGKIAKNGPEAVRALLNEQLADYGLEVEEGQVQINKLSLPDNIEKAIAKIFEEIFEKISMTNDIRTKAAVAAVLNDAFTAAGVDIATLSPEQRIELIGANLDRALANEGVAKVFAIHSRGTTPPGMIINPTV